MIQAITFDLWNTLFTNRFYTEKRINLFNQFLNDKSIRYSESEVKTAFNLAFQLPKRNLKKNHHIYTEHRISRMLKVLKLKLSTNDKDLMKNKFEAVMLKDPPSLKKGVRHTLEELTADYKIGLISNTGITPGHIINKVFQEYKILQYFQVKIFSDEIGFLKPNPILFKTALKKLDCSPRNTIHIGDLLETDIQGAKDCNMYTVWINDSFNEKSQIIRPDYEIQEISEVISIVKNIK